MEQQLGFEHTTTTLPLVCKLRKSLYGLKQAPQAWFERLSSFLHSIGFMTSKADYSLLFHHSSIGVCYILVYVDDIVISGSSSDASTSLISTLHAKFALKNL